MLLQRLLPRFSAASQSCARLLASSSATHVMQYSTERSSDEIGPGPGSRSRSLDQARAANETSTTSGPESAPDKSPDAPADPAELAANRGSDPDEVLRSSSWQAQQAMSSSYERDDQSLGGATLIKGAPQAAGRFAEKVASAADIAAQVPETNPDIASKGQVDTASGTSDPDMLSKKAQQGGYQEAADRLMDIEGLPKKS